MDYYSMRKQFSAYSAIFNLTSGSTFMRDGISNKVVVLYNDDNEINLPINNEMRLKSNLYNIIRDICIFSSAEPRHHLTYPEF